MSDDHGCESEKGMHDGQNKILFWLRRYAFLFYGFGVKSGPRGFGA